VTKNCSDSYSSSPPYSRELDISDDGRVVAVGDYLYGGIEGYGTGAATVFYFDGSVWKKRGETVPGKDVFDTVGFGVSISSDGRILAAGSVSSDQGIRGYVAVYQWANASWVPLGQIVEPESYYGVEFGYSVSISADGRRFIAGDPSNDFVDGMTGSARVFELTI
jgi:hypothetical protein